MQLNHDDLVDIAKAYCLSRYNYGDNPDEASMVQLLQRDAEAVVAAGWFDGVAQPAADFMLKSVVTTIVWILIDAGNLDWDKPTATPDQVLFALECIERITNYYNGVGKECLESNVDVDKVRGDAVAVRQQAELAKLDKSPLVPVRMLDKIMDAIRLHHSKRGMDRCWENDVELYRSVGLEPGDPKLPPIDEHRKACDLYRTGLYHTGIGCEPFERATVLEAEVRRSHLRIATLERELFELKKQRGFELGAAGPKKQCSSDNAYTHNWRKMPGVHGVYICEYCGISNCD